MINRSATWSLVLAGGEGSRLRKLTTTLAGQSIPKQYCSLYGGPSLIQQAVRRARLISAPDQVCAVVAAQHRLWWQVALRATPETDVVVQPQNRGTAIGILLPLLYILARDPDAELVVLPSDHHLEDEMVLRDAIRDALVEVRKDSDQVMLLGMEPDGPDPELGYIVPDWKRGSRRLGVSHFVEKPGVREAQRLLHAGALWSSFIMVARGRTLLQMFRSRHPEVVQWMQVIHSCADAGEIESAYSRLPELDLSRHVLQGMEDRLGVIPVYGCGWNDLGTPRRVLTMLSRGDRQAEESEPQFLNILQEHVRQREARA